MGRTRSNRIIEIVEDSAIKNLWQSNVRERSPCIHQKNVNHSSLMVETIELNIYMYVCQ